MYHDKDLSVTAKKKKNDHNGAKMQWLSAKIVLAVQISAESVVNVAEILGRKNRQIPSICRREPIQHMGTVDSHRNKNPSILKKIL